MSGAEDLDEREVKLALDDGFTMPAAADLAPARMDDRGVAELRSEYWDTEDLALARANRGLRHRNGIWTYKGQSRRDGDSVVREEREIEGAADQPPPALAARVADVASVKDLRVVAVLVNKRHTWCVRDGAEEVELVHDHVDVLRGAEVVESFAEAEVEFALDSAPLADRVVRALTARGATVNPMGKYSRALRALGLRPQTEATPPMPAEARVAPVWGVPRPLDGPRRIASRAEAVVIGGGITGVALLRELVDRGVDAILLERDAIGAGASGRNAGFLLAGVADNYAAAVVTYGRSTAREIWEFTIENHALIASSAAASAAAHNRRGSSIVAIDGAEAIALAESAALLAEDGFAAVMADPPQGATAMLVNPGDGEVNPLALVQAMAAPLASRIHERTPVVAVEDGLNTATVRLHDGGTVESGMVIAATNAWLAELVPAVPVRPVRAQMLAAPGVDAAIPRPAYAEHGHRYWRRLDDGTVLVGGFRNRARDEEVGYGLTPTPLVQGHLERQLRELGARGAVSHRWCGTMGFSRDGLPLVGRTSATGHLAVCGGYTGHGMGFAVHAARRLVAALVDGAPLPDWLDAQRGIAVA